MSIRIAVACALAVFLLSVALIIGIGVSQPVKTSVVSAAPAQSSSDVSQLKRDFLQVQQSESLPPTAAEPQNVTQNTTVQPSQPSPSQPVAAQPPAPVVAQPPPPQEYYYTTRAS